MSAASLLALSERCTAASGPDRGIDKEIVRELFDGDRDMLGCADRGAFNPTASFDVAASLLPPGAIWRKYTDRSCSVYEASPYNAKAQVRYDGMGATAPLQMCAAVLFMRAAFASAIEARQRPDRADGLDPKGESAARSEAKGDAQCE